MCLSSVCYMVKTNAIELVTVIKDLGWDKDFFLRKYSKIGLI